MLTIDFDRFDVAPGELVLDLGCGAGRHSFELYRRGADVVALDLAADDLAGVDELLDAMREEGQAPRTATAGVVRGDALRLPFADGTFDAVVASEILEHVPEDDAALSEIARVVKPGGSLAVSVPRWLPERICWALSDSYHEIDGGHVRIYRRADLLAKIETAGFERFDLHHAHALHSAYWWLKCATDPHDDAFLVGLYHRFLVWDLTRRPLLTRGLERVLDPLVGKSLVAYFRRSGLARDAGMTERSRAA